MSYYVHNVPGRLRVKTPSIKGSSTASEELRRILSSIEGVDSTSVNTLTGSVLITYNAKAVDFERILSTLTDGGYFDPSKAVTNSQYVEAAASMAGGVISKALLGLFLEKAFEGSALSLLTAFI